MFLKFVPHFLFWGGREGMILRKEVIIRFEKQCSIIPPSRIKFTTFLKSLPICKLSKTWVVSNEPSVKALANELGHIVADTALLPTQRFARSAARATFVADTNFTQKMFLILFRNILCPQQMFPSLRSPRNIKGNNESSFTRAFILLLRHLELPDREFKLY